jgi:hypothetical protein
LKLFNHLVDKKISLIRSPEIKVFLYSSKE